MIKIFRFISDVFWFYVNGFRSMTIGRTLWAIIIIKLFIMFVILKLFFFPNLLNSKYKNDNDKGNHVIEELTNKNKK